jgi:hypothetical protein
MVIWNPRSSRDCKDMCGITEGEAEGFGARRICQFKMLVTDKYNL